MKRTRQLDDVLPLVHGTVCSLRSSEPRILRAAERGAPSDPLVRAALLAGVEDTIRGLDGLKQTLDAVRRTLE